MGGEGGFVSGPGGEGTPVVVFGYFGAEEEVAFADHLPNDVDDFQPAAAAAASFPGGGGEVGGLEGGAQSVGGGEEVCC